MTHFPGDGIIPDLDTNAMWSKPEYHGDVRSPMQRRQAAIDRQNERYARAAAYREGRGDEYDAKYWPEKRALRQHKAADTGREISDELAALRVTATEVKQEVSHD
ncbi:MAG TPA: hypothetical protein VGJ20_39465 [Xanthobacteraceae bacterium]